MKGAAGLRIEGEQTYLVEFSEEHLADPRYYAWLTDFEVVKYIGRPEYLTTIPPEETRRYVESMWASPYVTFLAIHTKEGRFIGTAKINFLDANGLETKTADIGIMIGERTEWGKGYAGDAVEAVCRHCFTTLGLRKLVAGCYATNAAVVRLFTKLGFVEEGRIRKKLWSEGAWCDHILMGCFPEEFKG